MRSVGARRWRNPRGAREERWIVALPAWGERCVDVLLKYTLPALAAALRELARPATISIWTDADWQDQVAGWTISDCVTDVRPVPGPDGAFESMSNCHRQAMEEAGPRDRVVLLTADMVVSREVLATAARLCDAGKQIVCCAAPRALEDAGCPVGASGRELLDWAWAHRHPMTRECTWPDGRSYDVWRMYFENGTGDEAAARVFLPHPLVVVPGGRKLSFRPTIDVNLAANFSRVHTHMITQPEEGAVVELSPADKDFLLTEPMSARAGAGTSIPGNPPFIRHTNPRQRMFFEKRVVLRGTGDVDDAEVVRRMLG